MAGEITLRFTGQLAPRNRISARTLSLSLGHLQRAIDKIVIYETRGSLRKYAALGSMHYAKADLIVGEFEQGSLRVPLANFGIDDLAGKINSLLDAPYYRAAEDQQAALLPIPLQVSDARNRAIQGISAGLTHEQLIAQSNTEGERAWYQSAVLGEFNQVISPLRSARTTEDETISFEIGGDTPKTYKFNQRISKRFNSIVTSKRLGPETKYQGILEGIERASVGSFPFAGKFKNSFTRKEMKLLVPSEDDAFMLNAFNLTREEITIWAAPLTVYGAFDEVRGDIVFLSFVQ